MSKWTKDEECDKPGCKDFEKRRAEHLEMVRKLKKGQVQPCLHDGCTECFGTGIRKDGTPCVHMISCPCPKCTPQFSIT